MPDAASAATALAFLPSFCGSVKMSREREREREREAPKRRQDLCRRRRKLKRLLRRSVGSFASEHATHSLGPFKAEFRRHVAFLPSFSLFGRAVGRRTLGLSDFERPLRRREGGKGGHLLFSLNVCDAVADRKSPRVVPHFREGERVRCLIAKPL